MKESIVDVILKWMVIITIPSAIVLPYFLFAGRSPEPKKEEIQHRALVVCPGDAPFTSDKWALKDGFIIVEIKGTSLALPHTCGLVWLAP